MTNKLIKKLADASYSKNWLDQNKVNKIVKKLTKSDLKQYIKELKALENKKRVYVYMAKLADTKLQNQIKKFFIGKKVLFQEDKNLIAGIKIVNNDIVFEQNLRNNLNNMINYIGQ